MTLKEVSCSKSLLTLVQRELNLSLVSRVYPRMGLPPSESGGNHDSVADFGVMSDAPRE